MTKIFTKREIIDRLNVKKAFEMIEEGFVRYSQNSSVVTAPGYLNFDHADVHIKSGYFKKGDYYVVKVASGFYENPSLGLPSSSGLMLLFSQKHGKLEALFLDEGYLTDMRTAIAGALSVRYLGPKMIHTIGILGAGTQARFQLKMLEQVTSCRHAIICGRSEEKLEAFGKRFPNWDLILTTDVSKMASLSNCIMTTTPSPKPLLFAHHINPGTHITGIGADQDGKEEIDASLFQMAHVIVDSRKQTRREETELGEVICNPKLGRQSDDEITLCQLTGLAIQDLQICTSII